ncbi:hypothetical protein QQF64_026523 [Cirrhinus molitorella]|uniref:SPRY-associated domain-containing protein n=1 Tax=Cirrhinus molitorella TaxID=172907 RepID=A0ABR3N9T4_9TELE
MRVWRTRGENREDVFFQVDVTLDSDTAHPDLILSDDGKQTPVDTSDTQAATPIVVTGVIPSKVSWLH